jgi:CBS domain-containing protein
MKVKDAMSGQVFAVGPNSTIKDAAAMMLVHDCGALPVTEDGRLIGMITDRDIAVRAAAKGLSSDTVVSKVMTLDPRVCAIDDDIEEAMDDMAFLQVRRMPVCKDGKLVGMIAVSDLCRTDANAEAVWKTICHISRQDGQHSQTTAA